MKIALIGATGFIGQELGIALVRGGHEVTALVRNPDKAKLQLPYPCKVRRFDPDSQDEITANLDGMDAVINLAGEGIQEKPWTQQRIRELYDSRTRPTIAIIRALNNLKLNGKAPGVLVNASAIGFYGDRGDESLDEQSAPGTGLLTEICQEWETCTQKDFPAEVRLVILRIGVVLGKGGGMLGKVLPIFRSGAAGNLGSGRQWLSWIHIDDMIRMIMWSITTTKASGTYNATAPEPATNAAFTHELARLVKRPVFMPAPEVALKVALGSRAALVLGSQKVFPRRAITQGFSFKFNTVKEALQNLCSDDIERGVSEILVRQWLPRPLAEVFPFFQNEKNLEILTPPFLNFHVVGKTTRQIEKGTLIDYKLKLHGLPIRWRTEILSWQPPKKFVDNQIKGPYALWHHTHEFEELGGGTLMTDRVQYRVPMGLLGKLTAGPFVDGDVSRIFEFRKQKARELFGGN
ncbi:MAG: hypothetical protein RIQ81_642 [Pseudomonadota bacterium]|jgi:uncharacterized protein (TIGR01777 family)